MKYSDYPRHVVEDIARLRRRIEASGLPEKVIDKNLLIGSWNIFHFGSIFKQWDENQNSPKRNLRGLAIIAEVIKRFDVVAIQEVKRDTTAIRILLKDFLGSNWGLILSDITEGATQNHERLAFIYDKRRVSPSGLAGEIVLPPTDEGNPVDQFDRTPYIVGFVSGGQSFSLLTTHILFGAKSSDRESEIMALAQYIAKELRDRAKEDTEVNNLIVLGDFNIDKRGDNDLFKAFTSSGLRVPDELMQLKTTFGKKASHYDQIAWFMGMMDLLYAKRAGSIDFVGAVYKELKSTQLPSRVSDHFPIWVEFSLDRSTEQMATTLGVDPAMPDPLGTVPE